LNPEENFTQNNRYHRAQSSESYPIDSNPSTNQRHSQIDNIPKEAYLPQREQSIQNTDYYINQSLESKPVVYNVSPDQNRKIKRHSQNQNVPKEAYLNSGENLAQNSRYNRAKSSEVFSIDSNLPTNQRHYQIDNIPKEAYSPQREQFIQNADYNMMQSPESKPISSISPPIQNTKDQNQYQLNISKDLDLGQSANLTQDSRKYLNIIQLSQDKLEISSNSNVSSQRGLLDQLQSMYSKKKQKNQKKKTKKTQENRDIVLNDLRDQFRNSDTYTQGSTEGMPNLYIYSAQNQNQTIHKEPIIEVANTDLQSTYMKVRYNHNLLKKENDSFVSTIPEYREPVKIDNALNIPSQNFTIPNSSFVSQISSEVTNEKSYPIKEELKEEVIGVKEIKEGTLKVDSNKKHSNRTNRIRTRGEKVFKEFDEIEKEPNEIPLTNQLDKNDLIQEDKFEKEFDNGELSSSIFLRNKSNSRIVRRENGKKLQDNKTEAPKITIRKNFSKESIPEINLNSMRNNPEELTNNVKDPKYQKIRREPLKQNNLLSQTDLSEQPSMNEIQHHPLEKSRTVDEEEINAYSKHLQDSKQLESSGVQSIFLKQKYQNKDKYNEIFKEDSLDKEISKYQSIAMRPSFSSPDSNLSKKLQRAQTIDQKLQESSNINEGDIVENVQSLYLKQKYLNKKKFLSPNIQNTLRKNTFDEENSNESGNKNLNNSYSPSESADLIGNQESSIEFSELSQNVSQFHLLRNMSKETIQLNDNSSAQNDGAVHEENEEEI